MIVFLKLSPTTLTSSYKIIGLSSIYSPVSTKIATGPGSYEAIWDALLIVLTGSVLPSLLSSPLVETYILLTAKPGAVVNPKLPSPSVNNTWPFLPVSEGKVRPEMVDIPLTDRFLPTTKSLVCALDVTLRLAEVKIPDIFKEFTCPKEVDPWMTTSFR